MQPDQHLINPEFIINQALDKQRIVITGSRRNPVTAIVLHVLHYHKRSFDYVVSVPVKNLESTTRFSDAPVIIIEADEQKMLRYNHHIGLISNIVWNASDDFATEEEYVRQFDKFADTTPKSGILLYCENDPLATVIGAKPRTDVFRFGYSIHPHTSDRGDHFLTSGKDRIPVKIYGSQNFQNISGARELLKRIGITNESFYEAISSFEL